MPEFPHLQLRKKINGAHKPKKAIVPKVVDPITLSHLSDRAGHASFLLSQVGALSSSWSDQINSRQANNLPNLPDPDILPIFLKIDTKKCDIETLKAFGIEVVSEEEDGFIIGASSSDFTPLKEKIEKFIAAADSKSQYKDKAAQLWDIETGTQWRVDEILSGDLQARWGTIVDTDEFTVDVGIACHIKLPKQPVKRAKETEEKFQKRLARWGGKSEKIDLEREDRAMQRQTAFETLVQAHGGSIMSSYVDYGDSYSCRISISGKGLKDIVINYPYLFEVAEYDPLAIEIAEEGDMEEINPTLLPPDKDAPKVCVIDSGIQENHRLIAGAIDSANSFSFVPGDPSTADISPNGGHGTRVAGAILYPNSIPRAGSYTFPCIIQNARVLELNGGLPLLPVSLYPPDLMQSVTDKFEDTRIFNLSINANAPCRMIHMSQWAAKIDNLMFEKDILFVISAGNLFEQVIKNHVHSGRDYPNYLLEKNSRIGDPAQSSFALTVGSVCLDEFDDAVKRSFGKKHHASSFSRTGLGLWGMIKPDVVELAGDYVREKNATPNLSKEESVLPELVKAGGGSSVGKDTMGTSFSAPKVSSIAASLLQTYPGESANLYRTLIVQSARLPEHIFRKPTIEDIRHYGYGIPSLERSLENTTKRITFITTDDITATQANTYSIKVPEEMRSPGEDYDVLVEVTLSFMAETRRTRRKTNSYLSSRLTWESSKKNESYEQFSARIIKEMENVEGEGAETQDSIPWVIREREDWSKIPGLRRQDSTVQKSWCIMKSYDLPSVLSLAVIGHKGWKLSSEDEMTYSLAVSFEALTADVNVYQMISVENEVGVEVQQQIEVQE